MFSISIHLLWRRSLAAFAVAAMAAAGPMAALAAEGQAGSVSFGREVMAVLSKAGCNQGTCHGNQQGKNGFKLSLRGEDPAADYLAITH
ncbi:MAG TPA: hypothetical protein VHY20_13640, partial [Pirellulales bacterium]|nr:hypothetical protein [Pirellulales bacterium]